MIDRRDAIQPAFDVLLTVVDEVFPVEASVVEKAKAIVLARNRMSARDALHLAVMEKHGIRRILTFDTGFDHVPRVERYKS